jgi:O-antigen/teichoic acid export membrane protein
MRMMVYSALARVLGFIPQGIATLYASHLIIKHYGLDAFSSYALILSVLLLIPLSNLGAGASVTQAVAAHGVDDEISVRTGVTASRVLLTSGLILSVISLLLGLADLWPKLLGNASGSNAFVAAAIIAYGLSFVPGLGQSVLLATGRNHLAIAFGVLTSVLAAFFVWLVHAADLDSRLLVVIPSLAILIINLITMIFSESLSGFNWITVVKRVPFRRRYPGMRIRSLALPMLITSVALPVAYLGDRIVLSQVSTTGEVSRYALVIQMFSPVSGLIVATAQPLWPMFTRARADGQSGPGLRYIFAAFIGGTFVASTLLVLFADPIAGAISSNEISVGYGLPALAAGVTLMQAVMIPLSMSLIDPAGARMVAICSVLSVPANLTLSVFWAREWGAPGPLASALVVSVVVQTIPALVYSRRRARSGERVAVL